MTEDAGATRSSRTDFLIASTQRLSAWLAAAGVVAIMGIAALTILDVALRNLFSVTLLGLGEVLTLVLGVAVAACLPSGCARAIHLVVEIIASTLPRPAAMALNVIGALALLLFVSIMSYQLSVQAAAYAARGQSTILLGWPVAPFFTAMTALIALCVPIQILQLLASVQKAWRAGAHMPLAIGILLALATLLVVLTGIYGVGAIPGIGALKALGPAGISVGLFLVMWVAMMASVPLAAAMGLIGYIGLAALLGNGAAGSVVGGETAKFLTSETLAVLPLFLLMGSFATVAGLSSDIYRLAYELLKPFRGSLAHATIAGCAGFGALTGSSLATAATFGRVALPEMSQKNYDPALAAGSVAAGGTLGSLVPPSTAIILFALLSEQSIGSLFIAAIVPALVAVLFYIAIIWLLLKLRPSLAPQGDTINRRELLSAAKGCVGAFLLFGVVIGGIYSGVFTDTEAASVGAFGAFLFALARGKLHGHHIWDLFAETTSTLALIYTLIFGAVTFSFFIGFTQVPSMLTGAIGNLGLSPLSVIFLLIACYLLLGMFMDSYAMMVITVPIFLPMVVQYGYDPIWWGVLTVICVEMGMITPPFGMNIFMLKSVSPTLTLGTIYRGVMPFVLADVVKVVLIVLIPAIALWLPAHM